MSIATCKKCGNSWDAALRGECPRCLASKWLQSPDFLTYKHDPHSLSTPFPGFRTVVSQDYIAGSVAFLNDIAANGTAFYNCDHNSYNYIAASPDGMDGGSAVPRRGTVTSDRVDGALIAKHGERPHIIPRALGSIHQDIAAGTLTRLPRCAISGCDNEIVPSQHYCAKHVNPAVAD
jgi:hypothetical protein